MSMKQIHRVDVCPSETWYQYLMLDKHLTSTNSDLHMAEISWILNDKLTLLVKVDLWKTQRILDVH